jgi:DNA repair protein RadC
MKKKLPQKLTTKNWDISDRPREKYIEKGFQSLSDAEIIAILIRSGSAQESAVAVGRNLLAQYQNNLNNIADLSVQDLMKINGIGEVKAITIKAAFELGNRRRAEKITHLKKIQSPLDVVELMQDKIAHLKHEEFWVIFLNQNSKILAIENLGKGGITSTSVDVRLIVKKAILCNATALMICHNHPSGEVKPSPDDQRLTMQIQQATEYLNIKLLDHLILHKDSFYSFHEEGKL